MVVQGPMEPVVEELNRPHVKKHSNDSPVSSPDRKEPDIGNHCIGQIELEPIEDDLVIPVQNGPLPIHLLELNTTVNDHILPASRLIARQADPDLVVDHP